MVYCNKRTQIKTSNGIKHMAQWSSRCDLTVVLSQVSYVDSIFFSQHRALANRKDQPSLEVQSFYWRSAA